MFTLDSLNATFARLGMPEIDETMWRDMLTYKRARKYSRKKRVLDGHLSAEETAALLGVNQRTLLRWAILGLGPARIIARQRAFYNRDQLENWMRASKKYSVKLKSNTESN